MYTYGPCTCMYVQQYFFNGLCNFQNILLLAFLIRDNLLLLASANNTIHNASHLVMTWANLCETSFFNEGKNNSHNIK